MPDPSTDSLRRIARGPLAAAAIALTATLLTPQAARAEQFLAVTQGASPTLINVFDDGTTSAIGNSGALNGLLGDASVFSLTLPFINSPVAYAGTSDGRLLEINRATQSYSVAADTGVAQTLWGLTYNNGILYGAQDDGLGNVNLVTLLPGTAGETIIGALQDADGVPIAARGLTNYSGQLTTTDGGQGAYVYSIDPLTGVVTTLTDTNSEGLALTSLAGIAANPTTNALYATNADPGDLALYAINSTVTPTTTRLATLTSPLYGFAVAGAAAPEPATLPLIGGVLALLGVGAFLRRRKMGNQMPLCALTAVAALFAVSGAANAQDNLSTGRFITPSGTVNNVGSLPMNLTTTPDGKFALASNMGFRQYLSVFDTATGAMTSSLFFPQGSRDGLYYGLASVKNGDGTYTIYAGQGGNDSVAVLSLSANGATLTKTDVILSKRKENYPTLTPGDSPAGVALGGGKLFVANNSPSVFLNSATFQVEQGSLSVIDPATKKEINRYNFGAVSPLPNYPFAVVTLTDGSVTFVSSQRDGRVYVLNTSNVTATAPPTLIGAIATGGHPCSLLFNKAQTTLYVANATSDTVSVVNVATRTITRTLILRPDGVKNLPGVSPVGLALSPDESRLYVACGDLNAVAQIDLKRQRLLGYIPAGWYPTGVVVSPDNKNLLVANAKGVLSRNPNPTFTPYDPNHVEDPTQYGLAKIEGTVNFLPIPTPQSLAGLTAQTLKNARITPTTGAPPINPLAYLGRKAGKIQHVFYIIKENRTYDQVLGDLTTDSGAPLGDGRADLAIFGKEITPNLHALAKRFVLLDRFFCCSEASGDGWPWSTRSYANEYVIKNLPYNYSGRSADSRYDFEGQNNGYLVGGHPAKDIDGKILSILSPAAGFPPIPDISDGPNGAIWDAVKRAKLPYRNYGFGLSMGAAGPTGSLVPDNYPAHAGLQPEGRDLTGISDYDFRRFDLAYADSEGPLNAGAPFKTATYGKHGATCRFLEFKTEFDQMIAKDKTGATSVPAFTMIRFMSDHTSGLSKGAPTPRAYVADNDYAIGQFVELISKSAIWKNTAIFIIEDDSQDGPDHVDSHRSPCYVISPFVKKNTVDSRFYNTDSVLKTMELLLDLPALSQYDAIANPFDFWDKSAPNADVYAAIMPAASIFQERVAAATPGSKKAALIAASEKMDFTRADSANPTLLNEILWKSVKGVDSKMPAMVKSAIPAAQPHPRPKNAAGAADKDGDGDDN